MKHLLLLSLGLLWCCSGSKNRDSIVKDNVEAYIKSGMDNPDSYEYVGLVLLDSVSYLDNLKAYTELEKNDLGVTKEFSPEKFPTQTAKVAALDKLLSGYANTGTASYAYTFQCRQTNQANAVVLMTYYVQVGPAPTYPVLMASPDRGKRQLVPGGFPEQAEIERQHPL